MRPSFNSYFSGRSRPSNLRAALVLTLLLAWLFPRKVEAAVELVYFRTVPGNAEVFVQWQTGSEGDNTGFLLFRSTQRESSYYQIGTTIEAGGNPDGNTYEYLDDEDLQNGVTYWYRLASVSTNQIIEFYDPPVSAVPGSETATPTLTPTSEQAVAPTHTSSPTNTQQPQSLATSTLPPPTATRFPATPSPVLTAPSTSLSQGETPSTQDPGDGSLATVSSPDEVRAAVATITTTPLALAAISPSDAERLQKTSADSPSSGRNRWGILGLILAIWGVLVAWFVRMQRRSNRA